MSFIILLRDLPAQVLKTFAELQTGILRRDAEWADLATAGKDIDQESSRIEATE
jgi:hypothetical protein